MGRATSANHLMIDSGTLIDGTGSPALENALIVVEGERIKAIGKKGELPIPKGSRVISAKAKLFCPDSSTVTDTMRTLPGRFISISA
jgi:imidazolonepropionase-like amidohydrolase